MPSLALVRAPVAPLHAEPRVASGQVTQALFGHAVGVVGEAGDWRRVRTLHDGYEGWAHVGYLHALPGDPLPDDAPALAPYEARTFAEGEPETADAVRATFGDEVPALSLGAAVRAGGRTLRLPLGALVHGPQALTDGEAVALDARAERFPRDGAAAAASAWRFEGTAYQWGGLTPWGADCSGFVQAVWGLHGVALPRDAWQQALVGAELGRDLGALAAGDLLFFSDREDRRVTHVGLMLDPSRMAHLALGRGGWSVEELADDDDPYVARLRANFLQARRVS
jgi:cell wall-associated NlpC family hydrolase